MKEVDLILFIGQSNMAGRGETSEIWDEKAPMLIKGAAYEYKAVSDPDRLVELKEPFGEKENNPYGINDTFQDGKASKTGSLVTAFCNAYYESTQTVIVGVSASKGGSSIAEWQADSPSGYLVDAMERYEAAKRYLAGNDILIKRSFAVWCQGETDGDRGTTKEEYVFGFMKMWTEMKKHIPELFMIKIGQCNVLNYENRYDSIRMAQDIIALNDGIHIGSDCFYSMRAQGLMKDAFHYFQKGYNLCGNEAGKNVAAFYLEKKQSFCLNLYQYDILLPNEKKYYIQNVINQCAEKGGGKISIPEGIWYSGPLHLKSNIELHLCKNAVIEFSDIPEDYLPTVFTRWEGMECYNYSPLIYAKDCENISITGKGKLIGNGQAWWNWKQYQGTAANELCYAERNGIPVEERVYGTRAAALRPSFIQFINCRQIILNDFIIIDGPQWTIHPVYCENVKIEGIDVITTGHNTDGINPDSCKNVWIENCVLETGDDCIAINSGMNEDGWRVNKPCTDISITNCTMNGGHGAIVIGSGMSGGVEKIYASDCTIKNTMQGIRIKSMRGRGGYVKNVRFENIKIEDTTEEAIQVSMLYPYSTVNPVNPIPPVFENIVLRNISGSSKKQAKIIRGLEDSCINNLCMENITIETKEEDIIEFANCLS